jgi:tetratricopeptide (TPR) repeat protein
LADQHLKSALIAYQKAATLSPENQTVQIGLAWITAEAGQIQESIELYRKLIDQAWSSKEKDLEYLDLGGHTITAEAGGYLIALLDKKKDKAEIDELQTKISKLEKLPRPITPIAIPLANGLSVAELEDQDAKVMFDADGSGQKREWSWITNRAAWLVYDPTENGKVESAISMFGNVTFWMFWCDGYQALASIDDNRDGEISGTELTGLSLWHDVNGDGVSDPAEVRPVSAHGIVSLSCRSMELKGHPDCIKHSPNGVTFSNGQTRPTYDLILKSASR